jgi:hypothetical protein
LLIEGKVIVAEAETEESLLIYRQKNDWLMPGKGALKNSQRLE